MAVYTYTASFKVELNNTADDSGEDATETMMNNIKTDIEQYLTDNGAAGDSLSEYTSCWINLSE